MNARILLIDDEQRWIDFARRDLQRFDLVVAHDTRTARAALEENGFDLIIASARRLDALERVASRYKGKRIFVTTLRPTTQESVAAYKRGARDYFPKTFGTGDLLKRVTRVVAAQPAFASVQI